MVILTFDRAVTDCNHHESLSTNQTYFQQPNLYIKTVHETPFSSFPVSLLFFSLSKDNSVFIEMCKLVFPKAQPTNYSEL